jgi:hypothetical protein
MKTLLPRPPAASGHPDALRYQAPLVHFFDGLGVSVHCLLQVDEK